MRRNDASKLKQAFNKKRKIKLDEIIAKETKELLGEKNVTESVEIIEIPVVEEESKQNMTAITNVHRILKEAQQQINDNLNTVFEEYIDDYVAEEQEPVIEPEIPKVVPGTSDSSAAAAKKRHEAIFAKRAAHLEALANAKKARADAAAEKKAKAANIIETPDEAIPYAVYLARKKPEDPEIIEIPVVEEESKQNNMVAIANVHRILKEAQQVNDNLNTVFEEYIDDYVAEEQEPVIEPEIPEVEKAANIIEATVQKLTEYGTDLIPITELTILQDQVATLKKRFGEMNAIGWGQRGMDYGSGEVRLEFLDDVNRDSAKTDGYYLQYQSSTGKWIGSASTETEFDPAGYEYTNDSLLKLIENDTDNNGLVVEEGIWTKLTCSGYTTNNLPSGTHSGIAGTVAFTGSGSTTYSRIWNSTVARFFFDELDVKTVLIFRLKVDMIPETNNTLVSARINFRAMADGTDDPLLETSTTEPLQVDRILLEDSSGYIAGDTFLSYSFQQTVSGQELADGADVEHERTFFFPIYVGDSAGQRGFGEFEIYTTAEMVVNDTSILGFLN